MICYLDRTFCASPGCKNKCGRNLTPEIQQTAKEWWLEVTNGRSDEAPIAFSYFCGEDANEKHTSDSNNRDLS